MFYEIPKHHKLIPPAEREHIHTSIEEAKAHDDGLGKQQITWSEIFRYRQVWALISAKFLTDSAWFFFIFWLPKYLADVRHLNIKQIGYYAWIQYAFAGAGSFWRFGE